MEQETWGDALRMLMPQVRGCTLTPGCGQCVDMVLPPELWEMVSET